MEKTMTLEERNAALMAMMTPGLFTNLVVTRHKALFDLMVERHIVSSKCEVVSHIEDPSILKGKHVFGELPIHLASLCDSYTEIPLALTPKDNGKELTLARLRKIAGEPLTYKVILFAKNGLFC